MGEVSDLVMPKLGLTMTEGTVARWVASPGKRFAHGDVVVVIETDKIANEVEAPAAGQLLEILSPEGSVMPVGAPIGRWLLDQAPSRPAPADRAADAAATVATSSPAAADDRAGTAPRGAPVPRPAVDRSGSARIIATPYARRLAREAGLDLAHITGSGAGRRIKAADITRERGAPLAVAAEPIATPPATTATAPVGPTAGRWSFAAVDIDVTALRTIDATLRTAGDGEFERRHYVGLAFLKALAVTTTGPVRLGFESEGGRLLVLEAGQRESLSSLAAAVARLERDGGSAGPAGGDVAISVAEEELLYFGPAPLDGWRMTLGVGGVRHRARDSDAHDMSLVLSYDAGAIAHARAARLLGAVKSLLEEPLQLLAG